MVNLILFGSIVGVLSTLFFKGTRTGLLGAMLLGSVGAISGSFLASLLFESQAGSFSKVIISLLTLCSSLALIILRKNINTR